MNIWNLNGEKTYSDKLTRENIMFYPDENNTLWIGHSIEIDIGLVCPMDFFLTLTNVKFVFQASCMRMKTK